MIQPDEIIRSNRKTLAIRIDPFGRLIVHAPKFCAQERIFDFIRKKESWILQKKSQIAGTGMQLPPENLHGYAFLLLGETCKIVLQERRNVYYDKALGEVYLPTENSKKRLVSWLKDNAARIFTAATELWAKKMNVQANGVSVSAATARWGSCSAENRIRYTFRLLYAPKDVIEYVVVHELAHVRHKNHSKAFWLEVERYQPDWKSKRAWLKTHGVLLKIF